MKNPGSTQATLRAKTFLLGDIGLRQNRGDPVIDKDFAHPAFPVDVGVHESRNHELTG